LPGSLSIDQLQFDEAQEKADMVETLGSALPSKLRILAHQTVKINRTAALSAE